MWKFLQNPETMGRKKYGQRKERLMAWAREEKGVLVRRKKLTFTRESIKGGWSSYVNQYRRGTASAGTNNEGGGDGKGRRAPNRAIGRAKGLKFLL